MHNRFVTLWCWCARVYITCGPVWHPSLGGYGGTRFAVHTWRKVTPLCENVTYVNLKPHLRVWYLACVTLFFYFSQDYLCILVTCHGGAVCGAFGLGVQSCARVSCDHVMQARYGIRSVYVVFSRVVVPGSHGGAYVLVGHLCTMCTAARRGAAITCAAGVQGGFEDSCHAPR